jgi:hypothetical protein
VSSRVGWSVLVLLFAGATSSQAQQEAEVVYKHYERCPNVTPRPAGCTISETRQLEPGGTLRIRISETKLDLFTIDVSGYAVRLAADSTPRTSLRTEDETKRRWAQKPADTTILELTHSAKYGGYIVTITPKAPPIPQDLADGTWKENGKDTTGKAHVPGAAVIVVAIDSQDRPYAFSGGSSLTFLRSDVFVAQPSGTPTTFTIQKDASRRDAATVGFATFINVRPFSKAKWFWPGIGIGLETEGSTQYYFGPGMQIQRGIFFNVGAVLGNVAVLPAGLQEGGSIADPNTLSNLGHRKKLSFYCGLSFTFLGGGQQALGRPFAGASGK